jgi:hypothetical protein
MRKVDRNVESQLGRRPRLVAGIAVDHTHWSLQLQVLDLAVTLDDPRALECVDKRTGAAVHDRWLARVKLDEQIVDLLSQDCCEHVLDGVEDDRSTSQLRTSLHLDRVLHRCRDNRRVRKIDPTKTNTAARLCRRERQPDR